MTFTTAMASLLAGLLGPGAETLRQRRGDGQRGRGARRDCPRAAPGRRSGQPLHARSGRVHQGDHAARAEAVDGAPARSRWNTSTHPSGARCSRMRAWVSASASASNRHGRRAAPLPNAAGPRRT
jgi:hypothetical protein